MVHRDIKPANILLSQEGTIQLCDFGLVGLTTVPAPEHGLCTLHYRPPESLYGCTECHYGNDIWGVGAIFAELLTLRTLFPGRTVLDQICKIRGVVEVPKDNADIPPSWLDFDKVSFRTETTQSIGDVVERLDYLSEELIKGMLQFLPGARPKASECIEHSWFWVDRFGIITDGQILKSHLMRGIVEKGRTEVTFSGDSRQRLESIGKERKLIGRGVMMKHRGDVRTNNNGFMNALRRKYEDYENKVQL